jgi:hypothetical protein
MFEGIGTKEKEANLFGGGVLSRWDAIITGLYQGDWHVIL